MLEHLLRSPTVLKAQWPASPLYLLLPMGTPGIFIEVELGLFGSLLGIGPAELASS